MAKFVKDVVKCTHGVKVVNAIFPTGRFGWLYVINLPDKIWKAHNSARQDVKEGYVNTHCLKIKTVDGYKRDIELAFLDGMK